MNKRSAAYRHTVNTVGSQITPLAVVEAFLGLEKIRIQNISLGGMALLFDAEPTFHVGDILDMSVAIRERPFPLRCEIRNIVETRVHCAFVEPSQIFLTALKQYLGPKTLGQNLVLSPELNDLPDALKLVEGSAHYRVFLGQNHNGVFVWTDGQGEVMKLVAVSRELLLEWTRQDGLRTGRWSEENDVPLTFNDEGLVWDKDVNSAVRDYFADIFLSWVKGEEGTRFNHSLFSVVRPLKSVRFPLELWD